MSRINKCCILLENVVFHSFHGVMPQERKVGNTYIINLRLHADIRKAVQSDDVFDTVNYARVYQLLKEEMAIPSDLLEHVCGRIVDRLFNEFALVSAIEIKLAKQNPPMGADIDSAAVEMSCSRF